MKIETKIDRSFDDPNKNIKAFVSVYLDDMFAIHNIRLINGTNGLFVGFPNRNFIDKKGNKIWQDVCHPLNSETRKALEEKVLEQYYEHIKEKEIVKY